MRQKASDSQLQSGVEGEYTAATRSPRGTHSRQPACARLPTGLINTLTSTITFKALLLFDSGRDRYHNH